MVRQYLKRSAWAFYFAVAATAVASAGELVLVNESGWKVVINMNDDASFNRCIMQSDQNGQMLRVAYNGSAWTLSVPAGGHRSGAQGTIGFDGGQSEYFAFASDKSRAWTIIEPDTADFLTQANSLEVSVGNKSYRWSLRGSSNAMTRLGECLERFGD